MADRNERHFLEFYTPARERINRRAAQRLVNTERQQKNRTTPASDDKENPSNDHCDFRSIPATIPGEKAVGIGRHRRRLFTRSTSKTKYTRNNDNEDGIVNDTINDSDGFNANAAGHLASESSQASGVGSHIDLGSSISRTLFSTEVRGIPGARAIDKNIPSENCCSPPRNSDLLNEYRCKQSLLSSSKTRISTFSSPLSGGIRLRPSALWRRERGQKKREDDEKKNVNNSPSITVTEKSETKNLGVDLPVVTNKPTSAASHNDLATNSSNIARTCTKTSPMTPTANKHSFWSPPGTSRLLRNYRQRTEQVNHDTSAFLSPESGNSTSENNHNRSRTTPKGRKGLRLMESGAKRYRNHRLSLRPRPIASKATTPSDTRVGAKVEESHESTETIDSRSLLSPLTAKRLEKDIRSYRSARDRSNEAIRNGSNMSEHTNRLSVEEDNAFPTDGEDFENYTVEHKNIGSEMKLHSHALPDWLASGNVGIIKDSLPFDEYNMRNEFNENANQPSTLEPPLKVMVEEDRTKSILSNPEVVVANPSDEVSVASGVFSSTRSATRCRSNQEAMKVASSPDKIISDINDGQVTEPNGSAESIIPAKAVSKKLEVDLRKNSAITKTPQNTTRIRRKSMQDAIEAISVATFSVTSSDHDQDEVNGVARSTVSSTSSRHKSDNDLAGVVSTTSISNLNDDQNGQNGVVLSMDSCAQADHKSSAEDVTGNQNNGNDNENLPGIFRSTRSATRARRKSLIDMASASSATNSALTGKNGTNSTDNSISREGGVNFNLKVVSTALASPPQDGNNTPSSKGSLKSIWNALHCGSGDSSSDSIPSPKTAHDGSVHATIVSRVGDCVNPMAATLMKMWTEEEKVAAGKKKELESSLDDSTKKSCDRCPESEPKVTVAPFGISVDDTDDGIAPSPFCGLKVSPPRSFSSDLNLVYGLERVQNLTLARPKALQATRSMNGEPLSIISTSTGPNPLTSCS